MDSQFSKILLDKYQGGDSDAAFEIHARYAQRLVGLARNRINQRLSAKVDPEDVVQTAMLAFFQKADRKEVFWKKEGDLWRLLSAICINHVNREAEFYGAAKRNTGREQAISQDLSPDFEAAGDRLAEVLESVTQNESPLTGKIVNARLAGFTLLEIAEQLGRSERTIRRVLQILKAKLAIMSELHRGIQSGSSAPPNSENRTKQLNGSYDNYDLLRMLGAGGFGKVYLARDRRTDVIVAVKALKRSWIGDDIAESLFLNEAEILQSIEHPNIVKFLEVGPLPNGSYFFAMEFAEGDTLDQRLNHEVCENDALRWIEQICSALIEIHGRGTTHGDLKPSNLIVCNGNICLIDFGFSVRKDDPNQRRRGGTVGFLAPEGSSRPQADVFAAGKVIEHIVSNTAPEFDAKKLDELKAIASAACVERPAQRPTATELLRQIAILKNE